jgi:hypothetical protein
MVYFDLLLNSWCIRQGHSISCNQMETSELLKKLSEDFFRHYESDESFRGFRDVDPIVKETRWLGYPPVTIQQLEQKEKKLQTILPRSYKDFLLASNGFRDISFFLYNLLAIEKIDWARNIEDPWWLNLVESDPCEITDQEYLIYGDAQRSAWFRGEYFRNSLKISDWGDACCLFLNPAIQHEGEWEVLFYATWFPGTERHRSFKDFLIHTHKSNQELLKLE